MSQSQIPPGQDAGRNTGDQPSFAQTPSENPYYRGHDQGAPPNLDAAAPVLDQNEMRRLNRKALIFLACILVLVVTMVYWMMSRVTAPAETRQKATPVSAPQIPDNMRIDQDPVVPPPMPEVPPIDLSGDSVMPPVPASTPQRSDSSQASDRPRPPTLLERRISGLQEQAGGNGQAAAGASAGTNGGGYPAVTQADNAMLLLHPDTLLVRGTYLRCVLETRIITTVEGFTSCVLTEPVYSFNGRSLLLPKGTKLLGSYKSDDKYDRVPVIWDRLITPTGMSVTMASPGIDNLGGAGHPGEYNAHWPSRIASALLISLISDGFKWAGAKHGPRSTTSMTSGWGTTIVDRPFESTTAETMESMANQVLAESARRKPTVTIHQGTVVNIYVAKDVDFAGVLSVQ